MVSSTTAISCALSCANLKGSSPMQIQKRNGRTPEEMDLAVNNDKKRISRYHIQAFWILLTTFTLSLGYEVYREIAKAGVSSFDNFNTALVSFYQISFS